MSSDPLLIPILNYDNNEREVIDLNSNPFTNLQEDLFHKPRSKSIQPTNQPRKRVRRRDDQFLYPDTDYNEYDDTILQDQDEYTPVKIHPKKLTWTPFLSNDSLPEDFLYPFITKNILRNKSFQQVKS
jgi:hypothetical protein